METREFTVTGTVENELSYTWDGFNDLPSEIQLQDFHYVTGWSRFDNEFTGVTFPTIAERADVHDDAELVMFGSLGGYTANFHLDECLRVEVLFAYELDGQPLPSDHGGPLRVITPHRYAYKGAKWVTNVVFLSEPKRGYWEMRGNSNTANPWAKERYSSL